MAEAADVSLTAHEARAAGLDLWDGSRQYGKTLIYAEAGLETMAMVGMVALPETCSFLLLVSLPIWQEGRTASAAFRPLYLLSRPRSPPATACSRADRGRAAHAPCGPAPSASAPPRSGPEAPSNGTAS